MPYVLETPRLALRPWSTNDLPIIESIFSDSALTKFIGKNGKPYSPEECVSILQFFIDHYRERRFGPLALINKNNSQVIGVAGIKHIKDLDCYDLGFAVQEKFKGNGFATEIGAALIQDAFRRHKLPSIAAITHRQNKAAVRVLEKLGMTFRKSLIYRGEENDLYAIDQAWSTPVKD